MTELLPMYRINGPKLADILKPGIEHTIFGDNNKNRYTQYLPAEEVFSKEFLSSKWMGFDWTRTIVFYKTGGEDGGIHIDNGTPNKCEWGVNWVVSGHGAIQFWRNSDVKFLEMVNEHHTFNSDALPFFATSNTINDSPYLINANVPHSALGVNRFAVTLRLGHPHDPNLWNQPWETVVERFKDIIIK